ncbi:MAG: D-amino acid dehydrogenase, partial [Hyphomicrobiaceae bacterium]|nr:D-amino acid dehydrogenase [Hyphomicrobiaceae bacterium]
SDANGAQISVCNAEVWNSWGNVAKGIRWMFMPGAPLLVSPWPTWHKVSWMAEFVRAISDHDANTIETVRIALASRARLLEIAKAEAIEFDLVQRGILNVYETSSDYRAAEATGKLLAAGGLERHALTGDEIRALEPALQGQFHGGFFSPDDYTGDIHAFTVGLAAACQRRGATLAMSRDVTAIEASPGGIVITHRRSGMPAATDAERVRFDKVVVCAGTRSRALAAMLGDRLNIYPVKGYSITVDLDDPASRAAAPWVSILDDKAKIVSSRLGDGGLRIAGTAELSGANLDIRARRIAPLVAWCRKRYPDISTRRYQPWAGLRPMLPTMLPRVGPGRASGVYYNTGHGHLGWTLAAATAETIAGLVVGLDRREDASPAPSSKAAA